MHYATTNAMRMSRWHTDALERRCSGIWIMHYVTPNAMIRSRWLTNALFERRCAAVDF